MNYHLYKDSWSITIWATTWHNQQNDCAPSEDSDQTGHPPSLVRVFAVRMKKYWILSYPQSAQRSLWSAWADAQADLSLRWAHSHFVGFVMSWLILIIGIPFVFYMYFTLYRALNFSLYAFGLNRDTFFLCLWYYIIFLHNYKTVLLFYNKISGQILFWLSNWYKRTDQAATF